MDEYEIKRIVARELEEHFEELECPVCGVECTFIKFGKWGKIDEEYTEIRRCLNCLSLFTKELKLLGKLAD